MTKGLGLILAMALVPAISLASSPVDAVIDGPENWSAPPYWSPTAVPPGEQSGRSALATNRRETVTGSAPMPFVAVTPCRLADTRYASYNVGAFLNGSPNLQATVTRGFFVKGLCGIPPDAQAVSLNATVTNQSGRGWLALWPGGTTQPPGVSTLNFPAVNTSAIANAAVVPLSNCTSPCGDLNAFSYWDLDLILDVNGYYSPLGIVNSVNTLAGNVTLAPGTNVTITPTGNTLTIDAPLTVGPKGDQGAPGAPGAPGVAGPPGPPGPPGSFDQSCVISAIDFTQLRDCLLGPTVVFNSLPTPIPPNVPSQPFQAQQAAEFGDAITLAGTARRAVSVTVLMSNWAKHSLYPTMSAAGFVHPITVNLYSDNSHAVAHNPDLGSFTQNVVMSWRPESDPTCPDAGYGAGFGWRASNGSCYNGYAFPIKVSLGGVTLPSTFIYGIAYNTQTYGYAPIGSDGPYNSLNVGLNTIAPLVSVGTDNDPDAVYFNTMTGAWYADKGAGGTGTFRLDTNWTGYVPAVKFATVN